MNLFIQNTLLFCHIGLGIISVFSGFVALFSKKGFSRHVKFGLIFVWTMVSSSIIGSILGLINYTEFFITFSAGILSCTLIASSLLTLKQNKLKTSNFGLSIAAVNFLNFISLVVIASFALNNNEGMILGFPAEDYFFLGGMALICLIGDVRYFLKKEIQYHRKIARHLWRMCLGYFIAAGSAFTGPGKAVFPKNIQESGLLFLPEIVIFLSMIFWLVRTLYFTKTKIRSY